MTQPDEPIDLEGAIDDLYRAPLDGFVAARNALSSRLRKAGRREDADLVKSLVKPTATAWAVNQLWWREPVLMRTLLDAGAAQRAAHAAFAAGQPADVRAAANDRERAVSPAVDAAVSALGGAGGADARFRIAGTLEALASAGLPVDQKVGRLTRDLQASGFEALGAWPAPADATPGKPRLVPVARPPTPTTKVQARSERAAQLSAARRSEAAARVQALETALEVATREHAALDTALDAARGELARAETVVAEMESRLEAARQELLAARRGAAEATRAASAAEVERARAARSLSRARDELTSLDSKGND